MKLNTNTLCLTPKIWVTEFYSSTYYHEVTVETSIGGIPSPEHQLLHSTAVRPALHKRLTPAHSHPCWVIPGGQTAFSLSQAKFLNRLKCCTFLPSSFTIAAFVFYAVVRSRKYFLLFTSTLTSPFSWRYQIKIQAEVSTADIQLIYLHITELPCLAGTSWKHQKTVTTDLP